MASEISPTSFELLLRALDADDREQAGTHYVELRNNLVKLFIWRNCAGEAETHADETLNRAAEKLAAGEEIRDVSGYAFGIARLLILEINRRHIKEQRALEELPRMPANDPADVLRREIYLDCMENCLCDFSPAEREFFDIYYGEEKARKIENRKRLQMQLELSGSAFRMKALRLRERLEICVRACAEKRQTG